MDIRDINRRAWDRQVEGGNMWTIPVSPEVIAEARQGRFQILLTENIPVPAYWFSPLPGLAVLCLACGGGQQGPVLAAAGARVTVYDNSPRQLEQDRFVAEREGLELRTVEGDMRDLSIFSDNSFDFIFHPVSNCFIPDVLPVWREAFRVLRPGGTMLAGMNNPIIYVFAYPESEHGILEARHPLPYSDPDVLTPEEQQQYIEEGSPFEFSHTLTTLIGGQLEAGFVLTGFYEDHHRDHALSKYSATYLATRALKPA